MSEHGLLAQLSNLFYVNPVQGMNHVHKGGEMSTRVNKKRK